MEQEGTLTRAGLKTPRAAAIARGLKVILEFIPRRGPHFKFHLKWYKPGGEPWYHPNILPCFKSIHVFG